MNLSLKTAIQAQRIQAINLTVTDIDRSILFYTKALEFQIISDDILTIKDSTSALESSPANVRVVTLKLGDEQIRLMQYLNRQGNPIPLDSRSNDLWFQHLAIVVRDMDRGYAHLQNFPIESISTAPQTIPPENKAAAYIQAFKFRDPDRHPLELICFPSGKGQEKWHQKSDLLFLGIDHTAIAIADTEQSLQFYRDDLGMQVEGGSLNWGETQARLDGLPDAKVRITALRPAQGGLGIELLDYLEPPDGRPIPVDLKPNDIAYLQVEMVVTQTTPQFRHHTVEYIPQAANQKSNQIKSTSFLSQFGYQIKDPTGHFLLLIALQD